jgi:hypothetical protein
LTDEAWPAGPLSAEAEAWAVLRCYGPSTMRLAEGLRAEGVVAWTPIVHRSRRLPRAKKREIRIESLTPSFVFVEWDHADHAYMKGMAGKVPPCTIFRVNGQRVRIQVDDLAGLEEAQRKGCAKQVSWPDGTEVEVIQGMAANEQGVVVGRRSGNQYMIRLVRSQHKVVVPGFLLKAIQV